MAYCTAAQVRELLPKVTTTALGNTAVEAMIARAEAYINGKLACRYTVPFTTVPPLITTLATEIAAYFVMRTLFTQDSQNQSEWTVTFMEAMKMLDDIVTGKCVIVNTSGAEVSFSADPVSSNNQEYTPVFDVDEVENSVIDPDLLEDIADEKD